MGVEISAVGEALVTSPAEFACTSTGRSCDLNESSEGSSGGTDAALTKLAIAHNGPASAMRKVVSQHLRATAGIAAQLARYVVRYDHSFFALNELTGQVIHPLR